MTSGTAVPDRLIVRTPARRLAERRYVVDLVLREWLGLHHALEAGPDGEVTIRLAGDTSGRRVALPDQFLAMPDDMWLRPDSLPASPLARFGLGAAPLARCGTGIPVPSAANTTLPAILGREIHDAPEDVAISLALDIFGSVFFLVTRYEEVVEPIRDAHGRFPANASLASREGFLSRPLADEYVELLWSALTTAWPGLTRRSPTFRLRPTHDVDQPRAVSGQPWRSIMRATAGDLLRRRDGRMGALRLRSTLRRIARRPYRDPYDTFDVLMDASERLGLRSTFYFLAGNEPNDPDFRYSLSDPGFDRLLRRIHDRGHEIGLHASYQSHGSPTRLRHELDALAAACRSAGVDRNAFGVRQHYLRFSAPDTWRHQAEAGLSYDSTLGYADQVGFRAGTCREFPVFDIVTRQPLPIRERPLVVMDVTLLEYLALDPVEATRRAEDIIRACGAVGGDAVLLYHNNTVGSPRLMAHYEEILRTAAGGPGPERPRRYSTAGPA